MAVDNVSSSGEEGSTGAQAAASSKPLTEAFARVGHFSPKQLARFKPKTVWEAMAAAQIRAALGLPPPDGEPKGAAPQATMIREIFNRIEGKNADEPAAAAQQSGGRYRLVFLHGILTPAQWHELYGTSEARWKTYGRQRWMDNGRTLPDGSLVTVSTPVPENWEDVEEPMPAEAGVVEREVDEATAVANASEFADYDADNEAELEAKRDRMRRYGRVKQAEKVRAAREEAELHEALGFAPGQGGYLARQERRRR